MTEKYQKNKASIYKYYENNKEAIKARETQIITCNICKCEIRRKSLAAHNRTLKHINNLKSILENPQKID